MTFRSSRYIDFNTGRVDVPPMTLISRYGPRADQSIESMLEVFECCVDVWRFGPAVEMLKLTNASHEQTSVWDHSGYALLAMCFPYFEMVGKILNPGSKAWSTSKPDFDCGFCDVYPAFGPTGADSNNNRRRDVNEFRDRIRNGMFHLGYTKSGVFIHNQPEKWPEDFMVIDEDGKRIYLVNPHNLAGRLVAHFPSLMNRLRAPAAHLLRGKFKDFYIRFHAANGEEAPNDGR